MIDRHLPQLSAQAVLSPIYIASPLSDEDIRTTELLKKSVGK